MTYPTPVGRGHLLARRALLATSALTRAMSHAVRLLHASDQAGRDRKLWATLGASTLVACFLLSTTTIAQAQSDGSSSTLLRVPVIIASVAEAGPEAASYAYDALGRLVQVKRSGSVIDAVDTAYHYDQADNRALRWTGTGAAPPVPALKPPFFSIGNANAVREGDSLVFTVTKSGSANTNYSVNWATIADTALAGSEFQPASGTLVFGPGEYAKTVSIPTVDDTAYEGAKDLFVDLSGVSGGASLSGSRGSGTINSEDPPPAPPPASQAPTPQGETISTPRCGEGVVVDVLANDTDPDGNYPLNLSRIESVSAGFAVIEDLTNIRFTPGQATGTAQVRYVVVDSTGVTAAATLFVTLTGDTGPCQ